MGPDTAPGSCDAHTVSRDRDDHTGVISRGEVLIATVAIALAVPLLHLTVWPPSDPVAPSMTAHPLHTHCAPRLKLVC